MNALPPWFPRSIFGAVVTLIYVITAVGRMIIDRRSTSQGGWISLNGLPTFLMTFPVSVLGEWLGARPDYRRNLDMVFAIGCCAVMIYLLCAGLSWLARLLFSPGSMG